MAVLPAREAVRPVQQGCDFGGDMGGHAQQPSVPDDLSLGIDEALDANQVGAEAGTDGGKIPMWMSGRVPGLVPARWCDSDRWSTI